MKDFRSLFPNSSMSAGNPGEVRAGLAATPIEVRLVNPSLFWLPGRVELGFYRKGALIGRRYESEEVAQDMLSCSGESFSLLLIFAEIPGGVKTTLALISREESGKEVSLPLGTLFRSAQERTNPESLFLEAAEILGSILAAKESTLSDGAIQYQVSPGKNNS